MKHALVVFDTTYGNTEKLAREIAAGIDDNEQVESTILGIRELDLVDMSLYDGVLFGCPIHFFRATRGIKGSVKKLAKKGLDGKLVGAFETYQSDRHEGNAVKQIEDIVRDKAPGAKIFTPGLTSVVIDSKGPLGTNELEHGRAFGELFARELTS